MTDRQHVIPQWYLRNFRSNLGSSNDKARIFRMDKTTFNTEEKRIRKVACQINYLDGKAETILGNNEDIVSDLVTSFESSNYSEEFWYAYLRLLKGKTKRKDEYIQNWKEFCKYLQLQKHRSQYLRKLLEEGFYFSIISENEVIGSGAIELTKEGLKKLHSGVITGDDNDLLKLIKSGTFKHEDKTIELLKGDFGEMMKREDYKEFAESKISNENPIDKNSFLNENLSKMPMILFNKSNISFITSDTPVCKIDFDSEIFNNHEIYFFPISPTLGIILVDREIWLHHAELAQRNTDPTLMPFSIQITNIKEITEINYVISKFSNYVYSNNHTTLQYLMLKDVVSSIEEVHKNDPMAMKQAKIELLQKLYGDDALDYIKIDQ